MYVPLSRMCGCVVGLLRDVRDDGSANIWGNLPSFIICGILKGKHSIAPSGQFGLEESIDLSQDGLRSDDDDDSSDIRLLDPEDGGTTILRNVYCLSFDTA